MAKPLGGALQSTQLSIPITVSLAPSLTTDAAAISRATQFFSLLGRAFFGQLERFWGLRADFITHRPYFINKGAAELVDYRQFSKADAYPNFSIETEAYKKIVQTITVTGYFCRYATRRPKIAAVRNII